MYIWIEDGDNCVTNSENGIKALQYRVFCVTILKNHGYYEKVYFFIVPIGLFVEVVFLKC